MMEAAPAEPGILLVDDDPATIRLLAQILADEGRLRFATNGVSALRLCREQKPDLVLLDAEMPQMNGFQVCEALKADERLAEAPVIFVTSHAQPAFEIAGFEAGAADFITKPVEPALVLARVRAQLRFKRMADDLRRLSATDGLTGIASRRTFDRALDLEWPRSRRGGEPLSLLMVDVDHFKRYNDRYGHPAGDACLRAVAQALAGAVNRPADLVARYGGEEFAVLLPATAHEGAKQVAQRMLDAVAALGLEHAGSITSDRVTVSIGGAFNDDSSPCWTPPSAQMRAVVACPGCTAAGLLGSADQALYAAKQSGRARACFHGLTHGGAR